MFRALVLLVSLSTTSNAVEVDPTPKVQYDQYFQIEDSSTVQPPTNALITFMELGTAAVAAAEDLLAWAHKNAKWMAPVHQYNRSKHFGTWLSDPMDRPCLNTREKVLIRDSSRTVDLGADGCTVKRGEWDDPYAGQTLTAPTDIQIDHMVPLKNAYVSGASKWNAKARCVYANFMANDFHLIAVSGHENQSKGSRDPSEWMPPNKKYHCAYLKNWLSVKLIWGLIMSAEETEAIKKDLVESGCDTRAFKMSKSEIAKQRRAISEKFEMCD